ncbi:MAG: acyl carrier protein [Bacteroidetes bacterium]|nr:acyl carrier protein [Bacteroidota bacterium]MBL6944248.1 acyl carrier protein [Bacteroidales bacterium]
MNITDFTRKIEEEFEDLQKNSLSSEDVLRDKFTWDSINALIFLAHVNVEYDVEITADELIKSVTVQDLYNLVYSKVQIKG